MNHSLLHAGHTMDKVITWISIISNPVAVYLTSFWTNVEPAVRVLVLIGTFAITIIVNWEKIKSQIKKWRK